MIKIAVTGANSSVGLKLLAQLADNSDVEVIAAVRSKSAIQSLPSSPRIDARIVSYTNVDALATSLAGANCVVHLAGILIESRHTNYTSANVEATAAVVAAAQKLEVQHLVFTSVLGADPISANRYLQSKGQAEQIVIESGLSASIIRTPILLGPDTTGASALLRAASQARPRLLGGGSHILRPLDIDDLNRAIAQCCRNAAPASTVYELAGPEPVSYRALIERTAAQMGKQVHPTALPLWLARLGAAAASRLQGGGITPTVIDVITSDESIDSNADSALGISLTPLANTLAKLCNRDHAND